MKHHIRHLQIAGIASLLLVLAFSVGAVQKALAAPPGGSTMTYWVNDIGDAPDANPGDNICDTSAGLTPLPGTGREPCTLRAAIQEANTTAGAQVIAFEICPTDFVSNGDVAGSYRISPATPLPAVTGGLTYFNGYTQGYGQATTGYDDPATNAAVCNGATSPRLASPNTNSFGLTLNTVLAVEVDGATCVSPVPGPVPGTGQTAVSGGFVPSGSIVQWGAPATGACSGLTITSSRNVVAGLNIRNWRNAGILIMPISYSVTANKNSENAVWGNFIGANVIGASSLGNRFGIEIIGRSYSNYIGDTRAIPTWGVGDPFWAEEPTNYERNLISGNNNPNLVYGGVCTQLGGTGFMYDDGAGIFVGVDPCIRQNGTTAYSAFYGGSADNHVRNNYIGTDYQGISAVPNSNGVWLNYDAGRDSFNPGTGIINLPGNHIGGCVAFPFTTGANAACTNNPQTVDSQQDPNLISGNQRTTAARALGGHGIWLNGYPSSANNPSPYNAYDLDYNEIGGNFIGTTADGLDQLPNRGSGVYILANQNDLSQGPDHNDVGATTEYIPGAIAYRSPYTTNSYRFGNLISANGDNADEDSTWGFWDNGVEIRGQGAALNRVGYGNVIGLNSQGNNTPTDVGNGRNGVYIYYSAANNYVHNNAASNISIPYAPATNDVASTFGAISDNGDFAVNADAEGVRIANQAQRNHVFRNCIGGNATDCGGTVFGNHFAGVYLNNAATDNWIGLYQSTGDDAADNQGNWIHHNNTDGVAVVDDATYHNMIRFNSIWLNGNLGIDLGDDGVTANGDWTTDIWNASFGPNLLQYFPANIFGTSTWLITFESCNGCIVDIYASLISDSDLPSNGEGREWLQSDFGLGAGTPVQANISGRIAVVYPGQPVENVCITLTATDPSLPNDTSEFTQCQRFTPTAITLTSVKASPSTPVLVGLLAGVTLLAAGGLVVFRRRRA